MKHNKIYNHYQTNRSFKLCNSFKTPLTLKLLVIGSILWSLALYLPVWYQSTLSHNYREFERFQRIKMVIETAMENQEQKYYEFFN